MTDYTKTTNFTNKDSSSAVIQGATFDTEFDNLAISITSKTNSTDLSNTASVSLGDYLVGAKRTLTGSVAKTQHDILEMSIVNIMGFMTTAEISDVRAGTATVDVATAVSNAYAASDAVWFPEGTYACSIALTRTNTPIVLLGSGRNKTVIKNNSASSIGISLTSCDFSTLQDFTLDNNTKANHGLYSVGSTYLNLDRIAFKNYGNSSAASKYGLYLDGCTLSSINDISFYDNTLANGGHLYVNQSYYSVFKNFNAGKAGTANTVFSVNLNEAHGVSFHGLYTEEGGGNGLLFVQSSENVNIFGFSTELYNTRDPSAEPGWIRYINCTGVKIVGARIYQNSSTTPVIPLIQLAGTSGFSLDGAIIKRYVNSAVRMVALGVGNSNVTFDNINVVNADDPTTPAAVSYVFLDASATTSKVSLRNFTSVLGTASHDLSGVTGLELANADGVTTTITVTGATYTVLANDFDVICNRAGTVTLTLPAASASINSVINVRTIQAQAVVSAASDVVPITGGAAGTAILAGVDGEWASLKSDGTAWQIMKS